MRASSSPLSLRARGPFGGGRAKGAGQLRARQFPRLRGSHFLDLALLHRLLPLAVRSIAGASSTVQPSERRSLGVITPAAGADIGARGGDGC